MTLQFLKMAASVAFYNQYTTVTFLFSLDFDWICGILHNLKSAYITDALAFNVAVPFTDTMLKIALSLVSNILYQRTMKNKYFQE